MDHQNYAEAYCNSNCNLISFSIIPGDANTISETRSYLPTSLTLSSNFSFASLSIILPLSHSPPLSHPPTPPFSLSLSLSRSLSLSLAISLSLNLYYIYLPQRWLK